MGAGGAEGRMSKGSAGRGVGGRPEGTGASKSSPSSLISSAATGRAVPEPDRNRRGQARERPDPMAPQAPPNQPRELAPRGGDQLGLTDPREQPACLDSRSSLESGRARETPRLWVWQGQQVGARWEAQRPPRTANSGQLICGGQSSGAPGQLILGQVPAVGRGTPRSNILTVSSPLS